jgi:Lon protease-like protein
MSAAVPITDIVSLPETLPIFPLPGVLLLPRGRLPLNIFEPRYLSMTTDALGRERMIGMVQPRHPEPDPVSEGAAIYATGCAGRVVSFVETDDGRFLITLAGICRFNVVRELDPVAGYRRASVSYDAFHGDLEEAGEFGLDRQRLAGAVQAYFRLKNIDADWSTIDNAPDDTLITSLSMICPFAPGEKQALLECPGMTERGKLLTTLMEMAVHESHDSADGGRRH